MPENWWFRAIGHALAWGDRFCMFQIKIIGLLAWGPQLPYLFPTKAGRNFDNLIGTPYKYSNAEGYYERSEPATHEGVNGREAEITERVQREMAHSREEPGAREAEAAAAEVTTPPKPPYQHLFFEVSSSSS